MYGFAVNVVYSLLPIKPPYARLTMAHQTFFIMLPQAGVSYPLNYFFISLGFFLTLFAEEIIGGGHEAVNNQLEVWLLGSAFPICLMVNLIAVFETVCLSES